MLYTLPDDQTEYQIRDRLRRLLGPASRRTAAGRHWPGPTVSSAAFEVIPERLEVDHRKQPLEWVARRRQASMPLIQIKLSPLPITTNPFR